jgi:hypothetical protein
LVLRPEAVRERLLRLEEVVSRLESLRREGVDPRGDFRQAWLAERGLQLAASGVIDPELRERFRSLGGFRNLLVHGYLRLDPERVAQMLSDSPERFSAFALALRR